MTFKIDKKLIWDVIYIGLGCAFLAFAITAILKPNHLITGGITGISIILDKVTGLPYTYLYYTLSVIVLLLTYLFLGKREARKIMLLSILFPLFLVVFSQLNFNLTENDMFLASTYYGIIGGLGSGLILKRGYSSGGSDSLGKIINKRLYPFISISQIISTLDICVILISIFVFDVRVALYAILTQIIFMKSTEVVLFGFESKLVKLEIISDQEEILEKFILTEIRRGISKYDITGGFTNTSRIKLVTICSPRESMLIRQYCSTIDENAFIDVLPVISVWGKGVGFNSLNDEE
jgi:uncharacterized membrane-anchored protein YitT (DUF2179 family)